MKKRKKRSRRISAFKEKVAKNVDKQRSQAANLRYLKLPKGVSLFREQAGTRVLLDILPYEVTDPKHLDRDDGLGIAVPGSLWYKKPFYVHRNVGLSNEIVVCPTTVGKRCPICEYREKRREEGADWDEIKALKPSLRNLYVVVPINQKDYERKPHVWDISQFTFQNLLNDEIEEDPDNAVFPDPVEGKTLKIRFSEASVGANKFAEASRIDFLDRDYEYDDDFLAQGPNLDECLNILSYKELKALFFDLDDENVSIPKVDGQDQEEEDDEVIDEEEEDDIETDEDEEEDIADDEQDENEAGEEEKTPPKRKPKRTKKGRNKCPYGHKFGVDCDKYEDCDECELWEACIEAHGEQE